jgi:hypothetical protein
MLKRTIDHRTIKKCYKNTQYYYKRQMDILKLFVENNLKHFFVFPTDYVKVTTKTPDKEA